MRANLAIYKLRAMLIAIVLYGIRDLQLIG
jgi:hypothetical protein